MGFRYAHEAATRLPSKLTATQLKGRGLDLEAAEETPAQPESARKPWRTPQFLQDRPLTGREKGSATHLFMQFVHYEACTSRDGIQQELARLQSQLAANNIGPAQQKALVKSLMPMMKGPQRQRLQRILNMLGE